MSGNLWGDENAVIPSSEAAARELDDAFVEGMAFLRSYPLSTVGGIDSVLQVAFDLAQRRQTEGVVVPQAGNEGIGARLRNTVWNLASQANASITEITEEESEEEESEEESHPLPLPPSQQPSSPPLDTRGRPTLSSRLANTVWKGITNQSAMEDPGSPVTASPVRSPAPVASPLPMSPQASPETLPPTSPPRASKIWGYAEKFRDSDAAATLAKVSTNWRVRAMDAWTKRASQTAPSTPASSTLSPLLPSLTNLAPGNDAMKRGSLGVNPSPRIVEDQRRSSLPGLNRSPSYSPPPRPVFAPVRDSVLPESHRDRDSIISPTRSETSPGSDSGSTSGKRRQDSLASFVSLSRGPSPQPGKSGPRPLLLSSSSLITEHGTSTQPQSMSLADKQWADTVRSRRPNAVHRNSQSSISSMSPSEQVARPRRADTVWPPVDSSGSRIVPLHRRTPSPMGRSRRNMSVVVTPTISPSSPPKTHRRIPTEAEALAYEALRQRTSPSSNGHNSPVNGPSPPPPHTPISSELFKDTIRVKTPEPQRGSVVLTDPGDSTTDVPDILSSLSKDGPDLTLHLGDNDSSVARVPTRSSRVRSKRYPPRLASLRPKETTKTTSPLTTEPRAPSPSKLAAPELSEEADPTTPRAKTFDRSAVPHRATQVSPRVRVQKLAGERTGEKGRKLSKDGRARKISVEAPRTRKVSNEGREVRHKRESAAVEGDDEGYDDLLSAYESEESVVAR